MWSGIFNTPILWCLVGLLLGCVNYRIPRGLFFASMLVHYAALPFILSNGSFFGDWSYVNRVSGGVTLALMIYGLGQAALWTVCVRTLLDRELKARFAKEDIFITLVFLVPIFLLATGLIVWGNSWVPE